MSKVKIQGNASGSGTLTIEAPNTNTDRTITLPDTTGTLLDTNSSLSSSKLTGALPAIDGSNLTGIGGGITEADQWRLTTDINGSQGVITANLERVDTAGQGTIGTGMTQASGVFTFPSTGVWMVRFLWTGAGYTGSDSFLYPYIEGTQNNGTSWSLITRSSTNESTSSSYTSANCETFWDVTDTANQKVRFVLGSYAQNTMGSSTENRTYMTFIRLGDT